MQYSAVPLYFLCSDICTTFVKQHTSVWASSFHISLLMTLLLILILILTLLFIIVINHYNHLVYSPYMLQEDIGDTATPKWHITCKSSISLLFQNFLCLLDLLRLFAENYVFACHCRACQLCVVRVPASVAYSFLSDFLISNFICPYLTPGNTFVAEVRTCTFSTTSGILLNEHHSLHVVVLPCAFSATITGNYQLLSMCSFVCLVAIPPVTGLRHVACGWRFFGYSVTGF